MVLVIHKRLPFLYALELRVKVWKHIKENADKKGIYMDVVNEYAEHCHCLALLSSDQTVEKLLS